ncbi:TRAP transporter small permease [Martelella mediterranea]|uniref:TRAP transporter small permease n=1 Tax=uncultured Martelella sp. TaxID=392331 RepID=UPI000D05F3C7|nr:TRAP transporter small permease [uncultured Martelella sp.]
MSLIERLLGRMALALMWLAAFCLVAMALQVTADVIGKYFFNRPIPGTAEIVARYYMLAVVFLPLPFAELRNSGISVDLFYNMFGRRLRRSTVIFAYLGQLAFFGMLAYQSSLDAVDSFQKLEFLDGQAKIFIWPGTFFLPLGLWLVSAVSLLRIFQTCLLSDWEQVVNFQPTADEYHPAQDMS